jgi:hypothetical protein
MTIDPQFLLVRMDDWWSSIHGLWYGYGGHLKNQYVRLVSEREYGGRFGMTRYFVKGEAVERGWISTSGAWMEWARR